MSKSALWWVRWDENLGTYESRMTVGGRKATSEDFIERGFDRVVFLGSLGYSGPHVPENGTNQYRYHKLQEYVRALCNGHYDWSIDSNNPNKGKSRYDVGYSDGQFLSLWISSRVGTIKYYVPIPFSYGLDNSIRNPLNGKKRYSALPRDCPINGFDRSYWHGWIDGVLSVVDDYRVGFYWSYESCLQATKHDPNFVDYFDPMCNANTKEYVDGYITFIRDIFRYIHNRGQELIWIPTIGNRTMEYVTNPDYVAIPTLAKYFNHVFVQPHYYQTTKLNDGGDYTFQELVARVRWLIDNGLSIEMEADNSIIGEKSNCAYCKSTQGWWKNSTFHEKVGCDETPTPETEEKCINRACDYYRALLEISSTTFSTRAYYFGTNLRVVDKVKEKCPDW